MNDKRNQLTIIQDSKEKTVYREEPKGLAGDPVYNLEEVVGALR